MKYNLVQMQEIYRKWFESGLNRKEFCQKHDIAYHVFNYWHKRITSPEDSGFAEVDLKSLPVPSGGFMEVTFPSGARITFQGEPSVTWLRELIR